MVKKYWNVKMNHKKLFLIFLLILIPILVLSLHIVSNMIIGNMIIKEGKDQTTEFFGIDVPLSAMYNIVLYLVIFISISCVLLFLMKSKKRMKKEEIKIKK